MPPARKTAAFAQAITLCSEFVIVIALPIITADTTKHPQLATRLGKRPPIRRSYHAMSSTNPGKTTQAMLAIQSPEILLSPSAPDAIWNTMPQATSARKWTANRSLNLGPRYGFPPLIQLPYNIPMPSATSVAIWDQYHRKALVHHVFILSALQLVLFSLAER